MFKKLISGAARLSVGALLAFALLGAAVMPASALYVDQNRVPQAREFSTQQVHYLRFTFNYSDPALQAFSALPANSYILSIDADVTTAFNAGTTNVFTIGTTTTATEIVGSSGSNAVITAGTAGIYHVTAAAGLGVAVTGNTTYQTYQGQYPQVPLYVKFAQTGTAATAGSVTVVIAYVPNNDL
jgi:hypothetical protein